jgi:hypothetical protein
MLSTNFAGIVFPRAGELFLIEYDWMVSPGTEACYTYSYLGHEYNECTIVDESRWVSIGKSERTVKFFVKTNNISELSGNSEVTLKSISTPILENEKITMTYEVTNGRAKGRVFYINYTLDDVSVGGIYLRLLPNETREITDSLYAQPGDYALAVHMDDTYDAGRVRVNSQPGRMNTALGLPLVLLTFIIPFFILLKNKGHVPLFSLIAFTAFVSVLNFFDAFDKTASYIFIVLLWSVSVVARITYRK